MYRCVLLIGLVLMVVALPGMATSLHVLQPNDTDYSHHELAILLPAIDELATVLNDYHLGVRRYFSADDWNSAQFAAYTAGVLARKGYTVKLVRHDQWPDGTHTWVLVGVDLHPATGWIPVEATPAPGKLQQVLGRIPSYTDSSGRLWFDARYCQVAEEVVLPDNVPPVARIRVVPIDITPGRMVTFLGVTSSDPDGEIIFYHWEFGDGVTKDGMSVRHAFTAPGTYTVTLTVTDSRGALATTSYRYTVRKPSKYIPAPPGDCGCHK